MILIPFSSGLDSTTLVFNALQKKKEIELCYIEILNNTYKVKIEKQQREKIKSLLQKHFNNYWIKDNTGFQLGVGRNGMVTMPQIPVWICGLIYYVDESVKEIQMGYCMNDDAISFIDDIKKTWKSYSPYLYKKQPKITFPLIKNKKSDSYRILPNEIFQETYFCESPINVEIKEGDDYTWDDCGHCAACERAKYDGTFYQYVRNQKKQEGGPTFLEKSLEDIKAPEPFVSSSEPDSDSEAIEANDYEVPKIEEK